MTGRTRAEAGGEGAGGAEAGIVEAAADGANGARAAVVTGRNPLRRRGVVAVGAGPGTDIDYFITIAFMVCFCTWDDLGCWVNCLIMELCLLRSLLDCMILRLNN